MTTERAEEFRRRVRETANAKTTPDLMPRAIDVLDAAHEVFEAMDTHGVHRHTVHGQATRIMELEADRERLYAELAKRRAPATAEDTQERTRDLLVAHQRYDIGGCLCGWGVDTGQLGKCHARHVADALAAAGLLAPAPADRARDQRDELQAQIAKALSACEAWEMHHGDGDEVLSVTHDIRAALSGEATDAQ